MTTPKPEEDERMKKVDTQFATSMTADFDENTWTFLMQDNYQVWAGEFAIVDKQVYNEMIEKIAASAPSSDQWPFVKMKNEKWFYVYKDLRGLNQHSAIFDTYELALQDYSTLCMVKEGSAPSSEATPGDEKAVKEEAKRRFPLNQKIFIAGANFVLGKEATPGDERYKKALQEIIHTTASKAYTPFQKVERCFGVAASALEAATPSTDSKVDDTMYTQFPGPKGSDITQYNEQEEILNLLKIPASTDSKEATEILVELCKLKHYKDTVGKDAVYEKKQPELWKRANDFIDTNYFPNSELKVDSKEAIEWIDVEDFLPKDGQLVLIFSKTVSPAKYEDKEFGRYPNSTEGDRAIYYFFPDVTHWMPLPQPPYKLFSPNEANK